MSTTFSITKAESDDNRMLDTLFKLSTFANTQDAAEKFIMQLKRTGYPVIFSNDVNFDVNDTDTEKSIVSIDTTSNQDSDSSTAIREFNPLKIMIRIRYLPSEIVKVSLIITLQTIHVHLLMYSLKRRHHIFIIIEEIFRTIRKDHYYEIRYQI